MLFSALILSIFFSSVLAGYLAIILTKNSSYIFHMLMKKKISPVTFYLWSVLIINISSFIILFIFGILYLYLNEIFLNPTIIYFLITFLFNFLVIFLILIIKGNINKHIIYSVLFFAINSSVIYPLLLNRAIN